MNIDPLYFWDEMEMFEVDIIIKANNEEYVEGWEKTRFLRNVILASVGVKPDKMVFPWEEKEVVETISKEEDLRRRKEYLYSLINKNK